MFDIDPIRLGEFVAIALLVELTPGPNMGWIAALSARDGRKAGMAAVLGITLGLSLLALAAALGLNAALNAEHRLIHLIDWAGVAIMALLTWDAVSAARSSQTDAAEPGTPRQAFVRGLVTNLLNAKALAFFATVPPRFLRAGAATGAGLGLLMSGYILVSVLVHAAIVLLASRLGAGAERSRMAWAAAAGLAAVTIWLAWRAATAA
jgi:threonine/homoserine/homoserine lactone efflux protein